MQRRFLIPIALCLIHCGSEPEPVMEPAHPDIEAYISLLKKAEAKTNAEPLTMLAIMRQLYYGEPWSATDPHWLWRLVIPCSPRLDDATAVLGEELYAALASRAETGGVDMGHIFAGLESMICPFEPVYIVDISNEDFATWGGDLGAIAAASTACKKMGPAAASAGLCGRRPGGQNLDFYTEVHLPSQDYEGDLDPLAMRPVLMGVPCGQSRLVPLTIDRPLSAILEDYYFRPKSALGRARGARNRCILELIGAELVDGELKNRGALLDRIAPQVASFAEAYYEVISSASADKDEKAEMAKNSRIVTAAFLDKLLSTGSAGRASHP